MKLEDCSDEDFTMLLSSSRGFTELCSNFEHGSFQAILHRVKIRIGSLGLKDQHLRERGQKKPKPGTSAEERFKDLVEEVLTENSGYSRRTAKSVFVRLRSVPYLCEECSGEPLWQNKELILILDHRNGISNDHRRENLRWLCPNCNSQQDTFCRGTRPRAKDTKKRGFSRTRPEGFL